MPGEGGGGEVETSIWVIHWGFRDTLAFPSEVFDEQLYLAWKSEGIAMVVG